ncbi:MAG: hypothetical protein RL112_548 [Planctomycetota bacterium]
MLAGPEWRPDAALAQAMRPSAEREPLLLVLHLAEDPRLAMDGWRVAARGLARPKEESDERQAPPGEALERALAAEVLAADAIALQGGAWVDWWRRLVPGDKPSRVLAALREARARGATLLAFDDAAVFVVGGLVPPDEVGRVARNKAAKDRAWIVAGHASGDSLLLECEGRLGRGSSRVLDAVARELRLAGGREAQRAFVLEKDGALVVDGERGRLAPIARHALRLGFERARKSATKSLDDIECGLLPPRADPRAWWRAGEHPAWSAIASSGAPDLPGPALPGAVEGQLASTRSFDLASIRATLERGERATHGDATGALRILPARDDGRGARFALARWTRVEQR